MAYTAGDVMDLVASVLNDTAKTQYSYAVQLPYLKLAYDNLGQYCNANSVQVNLISEYEVDVPAGDVSLSLPPSFFVPITLQERSDGATLESDWRNMVEVPNVWDLNLDPTSTLGYWDYRHNCVNFVGSTVIREMKLYYWRLLSDPTSEGDIMAFKGGKNYLTFKTAEFCAKYIMMNPERAEMLATDAQMALDLLLTEFVKNQQGKRVRRKPFRTPGYRYGGSYYY